MRQCAFDIETDKKGTALIRAGWAVVEDGVAEPTLGTCMPHEVGDLVEQIAAADVIIGHNIADFDIPFLAQRLDTMRTAVAGKPVIDTLYLSPVAFPRNPYHHLYKDYKPFPLAPNDPAQDARAALTLLDEEESALNEVPNPVRAILLALLARFPKTADAARRLGRPEEAPARSILRGLFRRTDDQPGHDQVPSTPAELADGMLAVARDRLCIHAALDVASRAWADPQAGWGLAVVLAWLLADDDSSVIGQWPRQQAPVISEFLRRLRDTSCDDPECTWCRSFSPGQALPRLFSLDAFRPHQEEIIDAALAGENVLAVLPTGGGKSLCFQLPALIQAERTRKLTVVFSPLVSLMQDQVANMQQRNEIANCAYLSGLLSPPERRDVFDRVRLGGVDLLFLAPEQMRNKGVVDLLSSREIARWVVDEAHCISQWGHNFRVDYTYLPTAIQQITGTTVPISCFTATAKVEAVEEIERQFKSCTDQPFHRFTPDDRRTNLSYHIRELPEDRKKPELLAILRRNPGPAIVYVRTHKRAEEFASFLTQNGIEADHYHAGLDAESRQLRQQAFQDGELRVIVATTAFGMGIDKKDVRTVVLVDVPDSLEAYMQEIGRAGRDGNPSETLAIYSEDDISALYQLHFASEVSRRDLVSIQSALRQRARDAGSQHLELTAGEIVADADEGLSFDTTDRNYDTRTKVALHFLELQDATRRGVNHGQAVTLKLLMDRDHAMDLLESRACMTKETRAIAAYVFDRLEPSNTDPNSGLINTDTMLTALGADRHTVWNTIETMHTLRILDYSMLLKLRVRKAKTTTIGQELTQLLTEMQALYGLILEDASHLPQGADAAAANVTVDTLTTLPRIEHVTGVPVAEQSRLYALLTDLACLRFLRFRKRAAGRFAVVLGAQDKAAQQPASPEEVAAYCNGISALMEDFLSRASSSKDLKVSVDVSELIASLRLGEHGMDILDAGVRLLSLEHFVTLLEVPGLFSPVMSLEVTIDKSPQSIHGKDLKALQDEQCFKIRAMEQYCLQVLMKRTGLANLFGNAQQAFLDDYFHLTEPEFVKAHLADVKDILNKPITSQKAKQARDIVESLSPEQHRVLDSNEDAVMVVAGPGSGKTRLLVAKVVALITEERANPATILVLVYNRAACLDIRSRLFQTLGDTARSVRVCTFHSFAMGDVCCVDLRTLVHGDEARENFDRVIRQAADILETHAETGRLHLPYRYVLIDEYQDITPDQYRMVSALVGRLKESGDRQYIFAIGDDDQDIYAYNNTDVRFIRQFTADYNAVQFGLSVNYRSTPDIVAFSNRLIEQNKNRMKKDMTLRAARPQPRGVPSVHWTPFVSHAEQSTTIVSLLAAKQGHSVGILGRTAVDLAHIRWTLRNQNIPWTDLNQRRSSYLPLSLWLFRDFLQDQPDRLFTPAALQEQCQRFQTQQGLTPWQMAEAEAWIADVAGQGGEYAGRDLLDDLLQWSFEPATISTEQWKADPPTRVYVDTMHKSKGTEFDDVILVATNLWDITEDERRVWYVACTRARSSLTLFVPASEQALFHGLLTSPLAEPLERLPCVLDPASLPASVWSCDLAPRDVMLSFMAVPVGSRDVPHAFRGFDPDTLHISVDNDHWYVCSGTIALARLSNASVQTLTKRGCDPACITIEAPAAYVREVADQQGFVLLATLVEVKRA